jgi:hypothetical protein
MITNQDIITYTVESEFMNLIISNAKKAEIGGYSQFRKSSDRNSTLGEDQLVGQISTYCASMVLTGSYDGYIKAREKANANPLSGDGGIDIIGIDNVDIKGSLMRYSNNPLNYRLLVRPRERHKNWIYVLGLVPKERPYKCHLVGWVNDSDLPQNTYNGSIKSLHGAYVVEADRLLKISELITKLNPLNRKIYI